MAKDKQNDDLEYDADEIKVIDIEQYTQEEIDSIFDGLIDKVIIGEAKNYYKKITREEEVVIVVKSRSENDRIRKDAHHIAYLTYAPYVKNHIVIPELIKRGDSGKEACTIGGRANPNMAEELSHIGATAICSMIENKFDLSKGTRIITFAKFTVKNHIKEALNKNFDDHSLRDHQAKEVYDQIMKDARDEGRELDDLQILDRARKYGFNYMNESLLQTVKEMGQAPLSLEGYEGYIPSDVGNPSQEVMEKEGNEVFTKSLEKMEKIDKFGALCVQAYLNYITNTGSSQMDMGKIYKEFIELYEERGYKKTPDKAGFTKYFHASFRDFEMIASEISHTPLRSVGYSSQSMDMDKEALSEYDDILTDNELNVYDDYEYDFDNTYGKSRFKGECYDDYEGYGNYDDDWN